MDNGGHIPMPMPAVSIVVPVHNASSFLPECLTSIERQTFEDFEVICVDDGSTDGSSEILSSWASRNERLRPRIVRQQCQGVSAARNHGLELARGDFVLFADSDDVIEPELLRHSYDEATRLDADMTIFGHWDWYPSLDANFEIALCPQEDLYGRTFGLEELSCPSTQLLTPNVWRILFRRQFLQDNVRFHEELRNSEDLVFIYEALLSTNSISLMREHLYHYRRESPQSLTTLNRGSYGLDAIDYIADHARAKGRLDDKITRHLVNLVVDQYDYRLSSSSSVEEFRTILEAIRNTRFWPQILEHEELIEGLCVESWPLIRDCRVEECLFHYLRRFGSLFFTERALHAKTGQDLRTKTDEAVRLESELGLVRSSEAFRIGRGIAWIPSRLKRLFKDR